MRDAVAKMKGSDGVSGDQCLNVCQMVPTESGDYAMTLLAFAGYHGRKEILNFLISEGAGKADKISISSKFPCSLCFFLLV